MDKWRAAYIGLSNAGYTDDQIAEIAGVTRAVINGVRNGTYNHHYEPSHSGGEAIIAAITDAIRHGYMDEDPLAAYAEA